MERMIRRYLRVELSAPLVFAEGQEYNKRRFAKGFLKCVLRHTGRGTDMIALHF